MYLLKKGAKIFEEDQSNIDNSAFFTAIHTNSLWAVELFCDWGANTDIVNSKGHPPIYYAAL